MDGFEDLTVTKSECVGEIVRGLAAVFRHADCSNTRRRRRRRGDVLQSIYPDRLYGRSRSDPGYPIVPTSCLYTSKNTVRAVSLPSYAIPLALHFQLEAIGAYRSPTTTDPVFRSHEGKPEPISRIHRIKWFRFPHDEKTRRRDQPGDARSKANQPKSRRSAYDAPRVFSHSVWRVRIRLSTGDQS